MVDNPKIDRSFTYDSVNAYYTYKIGYFSAPSDLVLPTTVFQTPDELCAHLDIIAKERGIHFEECSRDSPYTWVDFITKYPLPFQQVIWKYREYVYACSVLFIASTIQKHKGAETIEILPSRPRTIPPKFALNDHKFTIVGSAKLTSDIDITIQGPRSSFIISLLEDLYEYMSYTANIPIRCWDIEFYGDFKILQSVFVNMSKFNKSDRLIILLYALVSYFRSSNKKVNEINPIVMFLVNYCITRIIESKQSPNLLLQNAYYKFMSEIQGGKLNRELFYRELNEVELMSESLKPYLNTTNNGKIVSNNASMAKTEGDMQSFSFTLFSLIMKGNVHRSESYIVPSTAVQVVEFEQKKGSMFSDPIPETWFSSNARIGIDAFGYIISAIEQLGYLEHYHPENVECDKKGIKYFGRLIRALVQAGLLAESSVLVKDSQKLNIFRATDNDSALYEYNIHILLYELQKNLEKQGRDHTRPRRQTRRNSKKSK
jgi:hypothetical protein